MILRNTLLLFLCISAGLKSLPAAHDGPKARDASDKPSMLPTFYLRDRSKITGAPKFETLEIRTLYGALSIPRDQILKIRFARRIAPELKNRIDGLIADLGNEDFDRREEATKGLSDIALPALEALRAAAKSTNEEVKNRATGLIEELARKFPAEGATSEELVPSLSGTDDEILTTRMTVKGVIPIEDLLIESRYGELKVLIADLSAVVFRVSGPENLKIEIAPTYQPPGSWLDTKFDVERGQKLRIEASGAIGVRNYGISSGPDGNRDWGGTTFQNFPMLSLIGKIGKRGPPFLIGSTFNGKAKTTGRLYMAVCPVPQNTGRANGNYKVTAKVSGGN